MMSDVYELEPLSANDNIVPRLHPSIKKNDIKELKRLLNDRDYKSFIDEPDDKGKTAVYLACELNRRSCLLLLIEKGAKLNLPDCEGTTPAFIAATKRRSSCLKELLERNAEIGVANIYHGKPYVQELHRIIFSGDINQLEKFFKDGEDDSDLLQKSALHAAVEINSVEIVKFLLERNVDIDKEDILGRTPIWIASERNYTKCLELLLDNRGDDKKADLLKRTPLHAAAQGNSEGCLKMLLKRDIDLSSADCYGHTVVDIIFAAFMNPEKTIVTALDSKICLDKKESNVAKFKFDFSILSPQDDVQMKVISNMFEASNKRERTEIFNHPLFRIYLTMKRKKYVYTYLFLTELVLLSIYWFSIYRYFILLKDIDRKTPHVNLGRPLISFMTFVRFMLGILQFATLPRLWQRKTKLLTNLVIPALVLIILVGESISEKLKG